MKILFVQRVLPRYREPLFENLRNLCKQGGHELLLVVSMPNDSFKTRQDSTYTSLAQYVSVYQTPTWLGGLEWQRLGWRQVISSDVVILPDSFRVLSNLFALLLRKMLNKPVLLWGHGQNFQVSQQLFIVKSIKQLFFRLADQNLVYTSICVPRLVFSGVDRFRIKVIENAVDSSPSIGLYPQHFEVMNFRERNGLGDDPCVVFLGSWYRQKRPEFILEIGSLIVEMLPSAKILVIGGGDALDVLKSANLPWLKLLGPLHGRDKYVALVASRCLAVTGVAGLNLLDAMVVGLPPVVPDRTDHSPEIDYVKNNLNGLIVADTAVNIANACFQLCTDDDLFERLGGNARDFAKTLTIDRMALNLYSAGTSVHVPSSSDVKPASSVVFIFQRMLPYHKARFRAVHAALSEISVSCYALEVASHDTTYGNIDDTSLLPQDVCDWQRSVITLFPSTKYESLVASKVANAVYRALRTLSPKVIFSPAPAFAEGAGALHYKILLSSKLILMDDAWDGTDRRGAVTNFVKRCFYEYFDGAFLPASLHGEYFRKLNIPSDRQRFAVNVVGPVLETQDSLKVGVQEHIPDEPFLLFVGRLVERKGLDTILHAIAKMNEAERPQLLVVGDGPEFQSLQLLATSLGLSPCVTWRGRLSNSISRRLMSKALAVLVPSTFEQWGLVINEAWLAQTIVLGSETVGALRATATTDTAWTLLPVNGVDQWAEAINKLLSLSRAQRDSLIQHGVRLAEQYSICRHVNSVKQLVELPERSRPNLSVGFIATFWKGRVVTW